MRSPGVHVFGCILLIEAVIVHRADVELSKVEEGYKRFSDEYRGPQVHDKHLLIQISQIRKLCDLRPLVLVGLERTIVVIIVASVVPIISFLSIIKDESKLGRPCRIGTRKQPRSPSFRAIIIDFSGVHGTCLTIVLM